MAATNATPPNTNGNRKPRLPGTFSLPAPLRLVSVTNGGVTVDGTACVTRGPRMWAGALGTVAGNTASGLAGPGETAAVTTALLTTGGTLSAGAGTGAGAGVGVGAGAGEGPGATFVAAGTGLAAGGFVAIGTMTGGGLLTIIAAGTVVVVVVTFAGGGRLVEDLLPTMIKAGTGFTMGPLTGGAGGGTLVTTGAGGGAGAGGGGNFGKLSVLVRFTEQPRYSP